MWSSRDLPREPESQSPKPLLDCGSGVSLAEEVRGMQFDCRFRSSTLMPSFRGGDLLTRPEQKQKGYPLLLPDRIFGNSRVHFGFHGLGSLGFTACLPLPVVRTGVLTNKLRGPMPAM